MKTQISRNPAIRRKGEEKFLAETRSSFCIADCAIRLKQRPSKTTASGYSRSRARSSRLDRRLIVEGATRSHPLTSPRCIRVLFAGTLIIAYCHFLSTTTESTARRYNDAIRDFARRAEYRHPRLLSYKSRLRNRDCKTAGHLL